MKILLITSIYPTKQHPDYGTFVRSVHKLYEQSGHEVTLVAFQREGGKLGKLKNTLHFFKEIKWALSKQDWFDGVNIHYPFLAAFPIARRLNKIKIPILISVHGTDVFPDSMMKRIAAVPTKKLLERCQRIIVPSGFFKERMMAAYDMPEQQFKVATPGGYDGSIFYPNPAREENLKHELADEGITSDGRRYIGFAGRLVEDKGWRPLIDAFAALKDEPEVQGYDLLLAGSGSDRAAILERIESLKISHRVQLTGALTRQEIGDFYRKLDFFVFPTLFEEALGMVGIEALACGIPVIASATGGVLGYIKQGYNGLLVEPGNVEELKAAILEMSQKKSEEKLQLQTHALESVQGYEQKIVEKQLDEMLKEELS